MQDEVLDLHNTENVGCARSRGVREAQHVARGLVGGRRLERGAARGWREPAVATAARRGRALRRAEGRVAARQVQRAQLQPHRLHPVARPVHAEHALPSASQACAKSTGFPADRPDPNTGYGFEKREECWESIKACVTWEIPENMCLIPKTACAL